MIKKAYIHEYGNEKLEPEQADVRDVLTSRGISCELFTSKRLHRNQLELDLTTLVVGDHPTIKSVLKRFSYSDSLNSYPKCLRSFLKRNIRDTTIGELLMAASAGLGFPIFVKPKETSKLFTGFVAYSETDIFRLTMYSQNTTVFVSEVVNWISEYRIFVCDSAIVGVRNYSGDELHLDMEVVQQAITRIESSCERTRGYALDFGILDSGESALVEWNDGYALGSYGLDKFVYTDLIVARWEEVIQTVLEK